MNRTYSIETTSAYDRRIKKLLKKNPALRRKVEKVINTLVLNPFAFTLRTHPISDSKWGRVYSSRVNGDLRIIWTFEDCQIILLQSIGGHSGSSKVYK